MRIDIHVHASEACQWLFKLRDSLRGEGHDVFFRLSDAARGGNLATGLLQRLELVAYGAGTGDWLRANPETIVPRAPDGPADLVIALSPVEAGSKPTIHLLLEGIAGIGSVPDVLLARRTPFVTCMDQDGRLLASGLPAVESPEIISRALGEFYSRLITLLRLAVRSHRTGSAVPRQTLPEAMPRAEQAPRPFGFGALSRRLWRRISGQHRIRDHWRVGIRSRRHALPRAGDELVSGFSWLADDGQRYYADPILFSHAGRDFLFVEEFPYETRKGVISVLELAPDGTPLGTPRVIIRSAGHLSYPYVFTYGGEIWMLPENAAEQRLPLYRARRFPDDWVHERDLLVGIGVHDATPLAHEGSWWLLANTEDDGGSSWDCLSLFRAASPISPYERVGDAPCLVDARHTRSAGPILRHEGRLIRPVQSCLGHYGRFLRFMEIDTLNEQGVVQHEYGRLLAPVGGPAKGVHTYSANERFEAIDAFGL